jgi:hypothetical protein
MSQNNEHTAQMSAASSDQTSGTAIVRSTYPGHPVRVAIEIMENFPDHHSAGARGEKGWENALSCSAVRGSGGAVLQGLAITEMLSDGTPPDVAYEHACGLWRRSRESGDFLHNFEAGNAEAAALRERFISTAADW